MSKNLFRRCQHLAEYAGLKMVLATVDHSSWPRCKRMARSLASLGYHVLRQRRHLAVDNVLQSGIVNNESEARDVVRKSFEHLGLVAMESMRYADFFDAKNWRERIELDVHPDTWDCLQNPDQGIILASGHLGNWEVSALVVSLIKPLLGIARPMNNPYVEALLETRNARSRGNMSFTPKHDADAGRFRRALKQGKLLAILIDQHAREHAEPIDFLGRPAATHTSVALLHLLTRAPICFGICPRVGDMRFRFEIDAPFYHERTRDRQADVRAILQHLNDRLSDGVRRYPEQYLWAHRRWR